MCFAIPGKVINVINDKALIDFNGETETATNVLVNVASGDYVLVQGGVIIQKIGSDEALEISRIINECETKP